MPISTSTKIRQYITSLNSRLLICMTIFAIFLEPLFSHMLVYTPWRRLRNAVCTPSMRSDNSLHAVSAPWLRRQSPVRTPWERGGTPWALLGNATVAVGALWHLHVMENVKLFAIFFSIFVRSHGVLRNFKSPWQRCGIAVECDRGLRNYRHKMEGNDLNSSK